MIFLSNAFSLQMLNCNEKNVVSAEPVSAETVASSDFVSVVGHQDTANVLTEMLAKEVPFNRTSVSLNKGDILYVAQVTGGRLPEGATTLPEGFTITFVKVTVE